MLEFEKMNGQWIGTYGGTSNGEIILELDDAGEHYKDEGIAYLYDNNKDIPVVVAIIKTENKEKKILRLDVYRW